MRHLGVLGRIIFSPRETMKLLRTLEISPDFPNSSLNLWQGISLSILGSATTTQRIVELAGLESLPILDFQDLKSKVANSRASGIERKLRQAFDEKGSDKGTRHQYSYLYATILFEFSQKTKIKILEVGLGTNNIDTPSNMGRRGKPGASIRAFAQSDPRIMCVGLDIDHRVLFEESQIMTAVVDQMRAETWSSLPEKILSQKYDLVIDDGLHSPTANLNTVMFTLDLLSKNGVLVVEDIPNRSLDVWRIVAKLGIPGHDIKLVSFPLAHCVVIAKTGVRATPILATE